VEWVDKDESLDDSHKQARFKLGDFVRFGDLLEDLIGDDKYIEVETNGK